MLTDLAGAIAAPEVCVLPGITSKSANSFGAEPQFPVLEGLVSVEEPHKHEITTGSRGAFYRNFTVPVTFVVPRWSEGIQEQKRTVSIGDSFHPNEVDPNRIFTEEILYPAPGHELAEFQTPKGQFLTDQARSLLAMMTGRVLVTTHRDAPHDMNGAEFIRMQQREQQSLPGFFPGSVATGVRAGAENQSFFHFYLEKQPSEVLARLYPALYSGEFATASKQDPFLRLVQRLWSRVCDQLPAHMIAPIRYMEGTDPSMQTEHCEYPMPGMIVNKPDKSDGSLESAAVHMSGSPFSTCIELPFQALERDRQLRAILARVFLNPLITTLDTLKTHNPMQNAI